MATIDWLHNVSGAFEDAADWKGGIVPGPGDDAVISFTNGGGKSKQITISVNQNTTVNSITLQSGLFSGVMLDVSSADFIAKTVNDGGGILLNGESTLSVKKSILVDVRNGSISADSGAPDIVANKIVNDDDIAVFNDAILTINSNVTGSGVVNVFEGTLNFTGQFNQEAVFNGSGEIELGNSQNYTHKIVGFSDTGQTALDLGDIDFVGRGEATFSGTNKGGVLTVTDGTHSASIHLRGDYLEATFTAASDGHGGTVITAGGGDAKSPPHALIAAMASFGAPHAHVNDVTKAWSAREPLLAGPRETLAQ